MKTRFHVFFLFSLIFTLAMTANARQVTLQTDSETGVKYINMPEWDFDTLNLTAATSFTVYDDGGENGNYSNNVNGYLVLIAPEGLSFAVSGTLNTESCCDALAIYKGDINNDEYLLNGRGEGFEIETQIIADATIALLFMSDGSVTYSGLELNVSVGDVSASHTVTLNTATGGTVTSNKTEAAFGEEITLTLTPSGNNVIKGVSVVDENGNVVKTSKINWYSGINTAKFIMPGSNVTVTPEFVGSISAADGDFINMPASGTTSITIPAGVTSFKVYDNGGKDGNHGYNVDGYLELFAPTGYSLALSGTVNSSEGCGFVTVYDGISANYQILDEKTGLKTDVGPVVSTENVMTIRFSSDNCPVEAGLDLTVTLVDKTVPHEITLNSVEGGTVSSDKSSAAMGETVTLTLAPSENKLLSNVSVIGADGTPVEVSGGNWYSGNTATFVMPFQEVQVTAVFVDAVTAEGGSFINMPVSGEEHITIPAGVTSFKVYDDGGKNEKYSDNANGTLSLVAPEGMQLMISGTMKTEGCDEITILDGEYGYETLFGTTGGEQDIDPVVSTLGGLMIRFESDGSVVYSGLDLTVTVVDMNTEYAVTVNSAPGGTVTSNVSSAKVGDEIALSITPNKGFLLSGLEVKGTENQQLIKVNGGEWYSDNDEIRFKMPRENVTVTPVFTNDLTAEGGLKVDMLSNAYKQYVYVPEGVRSFRVKYEEYADYSSTYLTLYAPEGYVFRVEDLEDDVSAEYFQILDYSDYGDNCIWGYWCGNVSSSVSSYSDNLTMRVEAQEEEFTLDMKVTLVDATKAHAINIATGIQGGSVQSEVSSAMLGEYVNLTATPDEGFLLASIDVVDSVGNVVKVDNGLWYSEGAAYFKMPAYHVTVTPTFTDDLSNLSINMPTDGNTIMANIPASVTSFKVYDDGGADFEYTKSSGSNYIVMNAPEGFVFRVTGSVSTGSENDYLRIIDGDRSGDILLNGLSGYGKDVGTYYSSGRLMTLMFYTGSSGSPFDGLDLTVELVDASTEHTITLAQNSSKGTLTSDKTSAATGETVTLNAVPRDGYLLTEIRVTDANGTRKKVTGGTWATSNTATFTMPYSNVSAEAIFTDNWTSSGLYINMPASGNMTVDIPEGVSSFRVYDDGGLNASSILNANGHLVLRAPIGYRLQVLGSITGRYMGIAHLSIHDGDASAEVIKSVSSSYMGGTVNVATVTSTGNTMTLDFALGSMMMMASNPADMALNVTLVAAEKHEVALGEFAGGTATIDKATAYPGETVTLTTHSEMGYLLAGVNVEDAEHNTIKVSETTWDADNTATFTMPNASVTVTPNFTNDLTAAGGLYLRLPSGGASKTFTVPEGVTSFKLYAADIDEGLCSGKESSTNSIELSSSNGSNFLVEGTIAEDSWLQIGEKISDGEFAPMPVRQYIGYTSTDIGQYQSTSGTVTISYNRCQDLDLTVTVGGVATSYTVAIASATGGTVSSNKETAFAGERVGLSITPDNNHVIERLLADNPSIISSIKTAWYRSNDVYFTMPAADVTITPVFSDALTAEDGLFIDMPSGWNEVDATIPKNVKSFKIYDDGGVDGNYITPVNGELYMHAPDGYAFKLTGSMTASAGGRLVVEVGSNGDYTTHEIASAGEGLATDVGTIMGDYMQLRFRGCDNDKECYGAQTYSGLDLTMSLVKSVHYAAVGVKEDEEGKMVATIDGNYDDYDDIDIPMEIPVDTVVLNRTFNHQTGYSTIVLPFNISRDKIEGLADVAEFGGIGINPETGKKEVVMYRVNGELQANTPYVIQMSGSSLVFHGAVTLQPTVEPVTKIGEWEFRGTLGKMEWYDGHEDLGKVYGFAAGSGDDGLVGKFVKAAPGAWITALRAYIIRNPASYARGLGSAAKPAAVDASIPDQMEVVIVDRPSDDGEEHTTVIGRINTRTGEFTMERNYDLKGRKLNGKPTVRGMYYGKKKIVK